ncbi:MAG: phage head spike fiber domain-containing protein [Bryobacteraceae bacterium]
MLYFPQLVTGATSQFPIRKTRARRIISSISEDGHRYAVPDESGGTIVWDLSFSEISDGEMAQLVAFFNETEGRLQLFTFFDPTSNLLFWSENPDHPVWQKSSFLQIAGGAGDPLGSTRATRITDTGAGDLALVQTINMPGSATCCFSVYARNESGGSLSLGRTSGTASDTAAFSLSGDWKRFTLSSTLADGDPASSNFAVGLGAGASADVFGFQVDAQPGASIYSPSFADSGVFPVARFDDDAITITAAAPNRNSCSVKIITPANR